MDPIQDSRILYTYVRQVVDRGQDESQSDEESRAF